MGGAGNLLLTGLDTYTGATNVTGGTLELARANIPNTTALTVGSNGVLTVDSGATLNVNGNVSMAGPPTLAGTMTVSSPTATIATADFLMTGGSFALLPGQNMAVYSPGDPTFSNPNGFGLRMGAGSQFTMSGGSLLVSSNGIAEMAVGDGNTAGIGTGPAVFTMTDGTITAGIFGSGNLLGLAVGQNGGTGIFNQQGGLVVVHGYGAFFIGGDPGAAWANTPPTPTTGAGTGTYTLSGGTLNTSEDGGPGPYNDYNKSSLIGVCGGTGIMNVQGTGLWAVADDGTDKPIFIGCGDDYDWGGNGTVNITGGTVQAHAGVMIGDVNSDGGVTGLLNLNGGVLDLAAASAGPANHTGQIYVGANGTFTAASGTLQNVTEIWGGVTVDGNGNLLTGAADSAGQERTRHPGGGRSEHLLRRHDHHRRHPGNRRPRRRRPPCSRWSTTPLMTGP